MTVSAAFAENRHGPTEGLDGAATSEGGLLLPESFRAPGQCRSLFSARAWQIYRAVSRRAPFLSVVSET